MKGLVNANFINKMIIKRLCRLLSSIKNLCVNMILYIPTNVRLFNIIFTEDMLCWYFRKIKIQYSGGVRDGRA